MSPDAGLAWRCGVCGYIHRGPEPPDWCPVCGSPAEEFEAYEEPIARPRAAAAGLKCLNCGYVEAGEQAPEECPVCGAPKDRFERLAATAEGAGVGQAANVVIVGAGIAGISAMEAVLESAPGATVTLLAKEDQLPYYRLNLTRYLAGEIDREALALYPTEWYAEKGVELRLGAEVAELHEERKAVALRDGSEVEYERLVLAAGAHPFIPPFPGAHREGVHSLRTVDDAEEILAALRPGMKCACVGGGLLGLETAAALAKQGADVTLLEGHEWLMPRQLNRRASELLARELANVEISLHMPAKVKEIAGDERVAGIELECGETIPAECVVIAAGVRPNSYLARRAGLDVNHGVVVDNELRASDEDVFAAGDVAEHRGVLYGNWIASQYQGKIAGMNAVGLDVEFGGIPRSNTLKVVGVDMLSIGMVEPEDGSYEVVEGEIDASYYRFVFHDGRFVGSVLLGDTSLSGAIKKAIEAKAECSGIITGECAVRDVLEHLGDG